ncbi:aminoglycoside phosphotransferase family protein [Nocardioides sp. cx-173]|uniref:aminoglycoside phosphotransferase family protein n=1 Tax=Nocardioides sp. cx-173 TaxID=2898796 RepID=UPI001E363A9C|nr:aminoglycoside phosphotransferase family protein [Nocardioides sp. cx-173]MCD4525462.1 aminoglycoside phosphotransferase family protein [Nocardioides sp. cx-173]UGB42608.1 aminoglycoside phosphotransferase family protein [Nocardioides sp. cx-173]
MANHDVTIEGQVVRKRYRRTSRDEPAREWAALVLLHEHTPGLAPRPLALETDPPAVVMSRVDGAPLDAVLTPRLLAAMVDAYRTLFAVPVPPDTPRRFWHPEAFLGNNVAWLEEEHARPGLPDLVRRALAAARTWHADPPPGLDRIEDPVLAQGDGKVDNMLWDGSCVRLVDFEGSGVGDLAFEVADLAEHISARLLGLRDPESVVAAFDLSPAQRERAAAYRIVLATFWLLGLLPGNRGHGLNAEGSDRRQAAHLLDLLGREGA